MNDNKKIAINTIAIYIKLVITTLVGLITSRYVLLTLGQSDFGLYNVVGSIIVLINTIGIAMHTTTRRYVNVEMGKGEAGNPNKIFNVSLVLHVGLALVFFIVAETIGILYINNYLQVVPEKIDDAHFVFQVSTIVACIGIINVPYQSLLDAFQKFWQVAIIEIICTIFKLAFVFLLVYYEGNSLRFFAVMMSVLSFVSFILYYIVCYIQWKDVITFRFYQDKVLYKDILIFNNYTALGAASCLGRTQGSAMLVNYFFGTLVNGALAVAYQIQSFTGMFANNLGNAAAPQITQAYSGHNLEKAYTLCSRIARMTILIMCCLFFPLYASLEQLMALWLKVVPEGALVLTRWTLLVSLLGTFGCGLSTYVHATGKIKWFQITGSLLEISLLPISYIFFILGYAPVTIIVVLAVITVLNIILTLTLLSIQIGFPSITYINDTYSRPLVVIVISTIVSLLLEPIVHDDVYLSLLSAIGIFILTSSLSMLIGLKRSERSTIIQGIQSKFNQLAK